MKPITIWTTSPGPNGWKPVIMLEELNLPYELKVLTFEELMKPEFCKLNPNGKVPVMEDPNTDLMLWESGAIVLYLIEQYDKDHKLTYLSLKEKHLLNQWLMFQMSQQGPYYGQVSWFTHLQPEKIPPAIERYQKQSERIMAILNGALKGRDWLVGDKCTYADLSFYMWDIIIPISMSTPEGVSPLEKFPNMLAWHQRMAAMESVKKVLATRQKNLDKEGMDQNAMRTDLTKEEIAQQLKAKDELQTQ